ncbi:hypothetical protein BZG01_16785 [Labilibaculum manganireducens]|uniref:Uncharacterized protein n=1 Tax=Labilibaculum manganireducens TaxID=1940525 RepID=A0A2N3HXY7_9BACT|nr:hypothetical protein [Labilibaculum manganireducens]PKQ62936.1 hypothetical protein BZG01_16785 [Labilibaculum manganireducens]
MKKILIITFMLFLGITNLKAQTNELIAKTKEVAILDAVLDKGLFNDNSQKLDITLFEYYSTAYKNKRKEITQSTGSSASHPSSLSDYKERLAESKGLWSIIGRMMSWVKSDIPENSDDTGIN